LVCVGIGLLSGLPTRSLSPDGGYSPSAASPSHYGYKGRGSTSTTTSTSTGTGNTSSPGTSPTIETPSTTATITMIKAGKQKEEGKKVLISPPWGGNGVRGTSSVPPSPRSTEVPSRQRRDSAGDVAVGERRSRAISPVEGRSASPIRVLYPPMRPGPTSPKEDLAPPPASSSSSSLLPSDKVLPLKPPEKDGEKDKARRNLLSPTNITDRLSMLVLGGSSSSSVDGHGAATIPARKKLLRSASSDGIRLAMSPSDSSLSPPPQEDQRIVPTPIKQRVPPSSFSVTSRPQHNNNRARSEDSGRLFTYPPTPNSLTTSSESVSVIQHSRTRSTTIANIPSGGYEKPQAIAMAASMAVAKSGSSGGSTFISGPGTGPRLRSSTLVPSTPEKESPGHVRQRSSGVMPPATPSTSSGSGHVQTSSAPAALPSSSRPRSTPAAMSLTTPSPTSLQPVKPFVNARRGGRESSASSTGDSSSGRAPLTPRDGSDFGDGLGREKRHDKKPSVTFEDPKDPRVARERGGKSRDSAAAGGKQSVSNESAGDELRRRERRRSEAKASIEVYPFAITLISTLTHSPSLATLLTAADLSWKTMARMIFLSTKCS
jgi:hypothetical protein